MHAEQRGCVAVAAVAVLQRKEAAKEAALLFVQHAAERGCGDGLRGVGQAWRCGCGGRMELMPTIASPCP